MWSSQQVREYFRYLDERPAEQPRGDVSWRERLFADRYLNAARSPMPFLNELLHTHWHHDRRPPDVVDRVLHSLEPHLSLAVVRATWAAERMAEEGFANDASFAAAETPKAAARAAWLRVVGTGRIPTFGAIKRAAMRQSRWSGKPVNTAELRAAVAGWDATLPSDVPDQSWSLAATPLFGYVWKSECSPQLGLALLEVLTREAPAVDGGEQWLRSGMTKLFIVPTAWVALFQACAEDPTKVRELARHETREPLQLAYKLIHAGAPLDDAAAAAEEILGV